MDIKSMYLAEIEQWMKEHGQPVSGKAGVPVDAPEVCGIDGGYVESSEGIACTDGRGRIRAH